ncbi:hypothetical protein CBL_03601 [Carabus blaptoides fortunei]
MADRGILLHQVHRECSGSGLAAGKHHYLCRWALGIRENSRLFVYARRPLYTSTTSLCPRPRSIGHNLALLSALEFFYAEPAMPRAVNTNKYSPRSPATAGPPPQAQYTLCGCLAGASSPTHHPTLPLPPYFVTSANEIKTDPDSRSPGPAGRKYPRLDVMYRLSDWTSVGVCVCGVPAAHVDPLQRHGPPAQSIMLENATAAGIGSVCSALCSSTSPADFSLEDFIRSLSVYVASWLQALGYDRHPIGSATGDIEFVGNHVPFVIT